MSKELSEYTFEEIEAEYILRKKQRREARDAERASIKRCRTCGHYGTVTASGIYRDANIPLRPWQSGYCPFIKMKRPTKNGRVHRAVTPSTKACEQYKEKIR